MFKSIIVPVDIADHSLAKLAIDSAVKLADPIGATLTLVHVVPIMPLMMLDTVPVSFEGEVADKAKITLADLARSIELPGGNVLTAVRIGGVYNEVLAMAEEARADLIVVGSHQPDISTYLLGSNSSAIVKHAPCSVLIIREENRAEVADTKPVETDETETPPKFSTVDDATRAAQGVGGLQ